MYAFIKGKLEYTSKDFVVVDAHGVGYRIFTNLKSIESIGAVGSEVKLYTYLQVRDDALTLYGFYSREELDFFQLLISVNGVGPKAALSLLTVLSVSELSLAIATGDHKVLTKAPGIGVKTAQRVVLELKDKVMKQEIAAVEDVKIAGSSSDSVISEVVSALTALGYGQQEAAKMVSSVYNEGMTVEEVLKRALIMGYNG